MMNIILIILVFGSLAAFVGYTLWQRRKTQKPKPSPMQAIIDTLTVQTPPVPGEFPFVLSQKELLPEVRAGIREGFRERIEKARLRGWANGLDPASYTVMIFPAVREFNSAGAYEPSFQVFFGKGDPYDESIYDQAKGEPGGWTYAAEQVLQTRNAQGTWDLLDIFVIADNNRADYSAIATANGLDHLFAYKNDRALYEATKDHSQGGGHPLW